MIFVSLSPVVLSLGNVTPDGSLQVQMAENEWPGRHREQGITRSPAKVRTKTIVPFCNNTF